MNNNKVIAIIAIILLNLVAGVTIGSTYFSGASEYDKAMQKGKEYAEQNLCSLSASSYLEAAMKKDSVEVRMAILDVYSKGIDSGEIINMYSCCAEAIDYINLFPKDVRIYEAVSSFLFKYEQYEDCVTILKKAKSMKLSSEGLDKVLEDVRYTYLDQYSMYDEITPALDGYYVAGSEGIYNILTTSDSEAIEDGLSYATPMSDGYAFVKKDDPDGNTATFLINNENVRQIYFNDGANTSTGVGTVTVDGVDKQVLAIETAGEYRYYGIDGKEFLPGSYMFAGRFRNNVAAVMIADNQWKIINAEGKPVADTVFTDVVLNEFNDCSPRGLIIAADSNGKYHVYNLELKQLGDFACDGAKAFVDDMAAVRLGDSWGFIKFTPDKEGSVDSGKIEMKIEPQYADAKSFSNGIAAVNADGVWGFVDTSNKMVIPAAFEDAGYLSDEGLLFVKKEGFWTVLQMYYVEESE